MGYHGQGGAESELKSELKRYFSAIDEGLMTILNEDQKPPMIVCCLNFHFPIYQDANTYQNLFPQHVSGNPADKDIFLMHEEAWKILQPYFDKTRQEKLDQLQQFIGTGKASSDIQEIIPAAVDGKIDTLFVE